MIDQLFASHMQTVVAAIIRQGNSILIAQRRAAGPHPLQWEFPGGKVEPGETDEQALRRELTEELGILAVIGAQFTQYSYSYPGKPAILLRFFEVESFTGTAQNCDVFQTLCWETPDRFDDYDFLPGDLALIQLLRKIQVNQV